MSLLSPLKDSLQKNPSSSSLTLSNTNDVLTVSVPIISSTNSNGEVEMNSPFYVACDNGDITLVNTYLQKYSAKELEDMKDNLGWSGLHYAARSGHLPVVTALIEHGFSVDILDNSGSTPLYRATGFGRNQVVYYLVQKGADPLHVNNQGDNMIHNSAWACRHELTKFFISKGVDVLQKNKTGRIALQDITENLPDIAGEILEKRRKIISSYLLEVQAEYDFDGIDDLDNYSPELSPLEIILSRSHLDLLNIPVIRALLELKWNSFARKIFIFRFLAYLIVLVLASYVGIESAQKEGSLTDYETTTDFVRGAFEIVVFLFSIVELFGELMELYGSGVQIVTLDEYSFILKFFFKLCFKKTVNPLLITADSVLVPTYLFDKWNIWDLSTYLLIVGCGIARIIAIIEPDLAIDRLVDVEWVAVIIVLLWIKLLELMGISKVTGPLIRAINRMLVDFSQWLLIYILFWMGFSIGFYLLLHKTLMLDYSNFGLAMVSTFRMTVGDFDWGTIYVGNPSGLLQGLFVIFILIANILLLNLLIAMLSNSYEVVKYVAEKEWLMEWAGVIMRIQRALGKKRAKYLFDGYIASLQSDKKFTIQNYTPGARVAESIKFSRWEHQSSAQTEKEMDIQLLKSDLEKTINSHFATLRLENVSLKKKVNDVNEKLAAITELLKEKEKGKAKE